MARITLQDLFVHDLSDIYSAEKQLVKALGKHWGLGRYMTIKSESGVEACKALVGISDL